MVKPRQYNNRPATIDAQDALSINVRKTLRNLRLERGVGQRELSEKLDKCISYINSFEQKYIDRDVTLHTIQDIADALDYDVEVVFVDRRRK